MTVQEMINLLSECPLNANVEITLRMEDDSEIFGFKIEHLEIDGLNDFFDDENTIRFDVWKK
jgi:hypothetical protein